MTHPVLDAPVSPLRQRLIDDMNLRRFSRETQRNYLRDIGRLAAFLGRSPDTATADDLRRFQIEQQEDGVPVPTMNSIVSALRFLFIHTLDRPGPGAQARPAGASAQPARGAEPRRGGPAAQCHDVPQAPGRALCRLWCGPARRRGVDAEGHRRRQRAHAAARRTRQGRALSQPVNVNQLRRLPPTLRPRKLLI